MDLPQPDPKAPVCTSCAAQGVRRRIQETQRYAEPVVTGEPVSWDTEGRKHEHYALPPTQSAFRCDCGKTWVVKTPESPVPCWCGWGTTS